MYRALSDDGTFATCLHIILLASYGEEIYQVDPLELLLRLQEDFNVQVTDSNENKLKAILLATETDIFYEDPEAFRSISETLTNGDPGIDLLDRLTVPEVFLGIYEVELNHGPHEFSPPVMSIIDNVIAVEADESDTDDPSEYVWNYLRQQRQRLVDQLQDLGISTIDVPQIDPTRSLENAGASPDLVEVAQAILSEEPSDG